MGFLGSRERRRQRYQELKAQKICTACKTKKVFETLLCCESCLKKSQLRKVKYKLATIKTKTKKVQRHTAI